jgi:hypothetical protein
MNHLHGPTRLFSMDGRREIAMVKPTKVGPLGIHMVCMEDNLKWLLSLLQTDAHKSE